MKKIVIALGVMVALLSISCSNPVAPDSGLGPTGGSKKLVGTWTNVTVTYTDLSITPAANDKEGTWTSTVISYPTVPVVTVTGTVTNYAWLASDVKTTTVTTTVEINASGSFVKTVTTAEVWTARAAAPANTATVTYSGATAAIVAGTKTRTITETYTVTVVGRVYKEEYSKTNVLNYTGFNFDTNATSVANDNTSTTAGSNVTEVLAAASLAYNSATAGLVRTVRGTTVGVPTNKASTSTSTKTITFVADGTYTAIEVVDVNQPAIDAVAATANSAAVIATAAGTTKETITVTGVYTNTKVSYDGFTYFAQTGVYKELQDLFQYEKTKTISAIGTGYLIGINYPATAKTTKATTISTTNTDIIINDTALIMGVTLSNGNANGGMVFIKS